MLIAIILYLWPLVLLARVPRVRCALGWHDPEFKLQLPPKTGAACFDLLNRSRPWCWSINVRCKHCRKTLLSHTLDERDAEAFLARRRSS
jgi:hypothetical protein